MENLTTTLWDELRTNGRIYLSAGSLKLNWIAIDDIVAMAAAALVEKIDASALAV